ncbi:quinol monooxygenase YgiN [Massilia umbonata]|uniref:Antibiotic biosynthesis monooxygenase n=1 Tax=Pseudoduganella umbonata TaxID=864828 RepID=A0A4P8HR94_9BURK|nr:putative quinol monooxygenase [Pseudoduganella umbonata]MBB3222672.1 quinol monooxygenase YgiN [Pseudoduganella umbonata]QCP10825.1 antibiotic biosynthesis monooxygenase [Pseudoduganella umbonata]
MSTLINVASFHARPGQSAALGSALLSLVPLSRSEPGNVQYDISQAIDDPDTWLVFEQWRSRGDFDFHMTTPYVAQFLAAVPDLCDGDPDLRGYTLRSRDTGEQSRPI